MLEQLAKCPCGDSIQEASEEEFEALVDKHTALVNDDNLLEIKEITRKYSRHEEHEHISRRLNKAPLSRGNTLHPRPSRI